MSIRPKIEAALSATADRLDPGTGAHAVRHAKNDLATIDGSSKDLNRRYADQEVLIAAPGLFEAKHPDGDPVVFDKHHEGIIVVFPGSFVFVRRMGFGAREIEVLGVGEVTVEKVTTVVDGTERPGLRITARSGKPTFAMAVASGGDAEQAAVRDEVYGLLTT